MKKLNKTIILTAVVALIVGGGAGYASAATLGKSHARPTMGAAGAFARGGNTTFTARAGGMGGLLTGTVAKEDSESITLNTRDGSSHVVLVTPATSVSKSVNGSLSDVAVGSEVIVSGSTNSDGSVSASLIQLRPAGSVQNGPMIPAQPMAPMNGQ